MDNISNINDNYIGGDFLDGQWCDYYVVLHEGGPIGANSGVINIDLSSILPEDNYTYICQIDCLTASGSSSGNVVFPEVFSGTRSLSSVRDEAGLGCVWIGGTRARSNSARAGGSWCYLPIYPEDRAMTIWNRSTTAGSNSRFCLRRIRRMGTNK